MTNATLLEKGLRPLGHSSSLLYCMGLCLSSSSVRAHTTKRCKAPKARRHQTMRKITGLLLASGAAGLQLHKGIKLAAPALPVAALLPASALAAADNYEYGSAWLLRPLHKISSVAPDRPRSRRPTDAAACHRPTHAGRRARLGAARGRRARHRDGAAAARAQGRRGGGRGDLQPGRERPVARPAQEPAALGS